ncbi:MAG: hypothetical protein IT422_16690 [Pirellulaceae bacterium]|nr:hypothetical protein [Pirellulaceae bacterium]
MTVRTNQLKPNPAGKDRSTSGASESQLAAEWVDIKNVGRTNIALSGVNLYHKAFRRDGSFEWELVGKLSGVLGAGQVLRVHSGKGPYSVVRPEDSVGSDFYIFTGVSRYIWNNDYSDSSLLWQPSTKASIDEASYDAYPPEGAILQRVGDKLVAPSWATVRR